jgi:PIN domain nuclease of toxin-antitoxin system
MILLDTHVLVWWVSDPAKLSVPARTAIDGADTLGIAAISCFEIALLVARNRLGLDREVGTWLRQTLSTPRVVLIALDPDTSMLAANLEWNHRDPADRMIVATAARRHAAIISKDQVIRACPHANTIW